MTTTIFNLTLASPDGELFPPGSPEGQFLINMKVTDYIVIPPDVLPYDKYKLAWEKGGIILSEPETPYKGVTYVMMACGVLVDRSFKKLGIPIGQLMVIEKRHPDKAEAYEVAKRLVNVKKCLRTKGND